MHRRSAAPGLGLGATDFDSSLLPSSGSYCSPLTGEERERESTPFPILLMCSTYNI